jgi:hypothetical protein
MKLTMKLLVIAIAALLIGTTAYGLYTFYSGSNNGNDDHGSDHNETDTEPPTITYVTGDTTVIAGQTVTISAEFSDNVAVTEAILYYRPADASSWTDTSILSGYATISIPSTAIQNYYYYVTVNDAAGNGPVGDPSTDGSMYYTIAVQPAGGDGNETLTHTVLVEESTATWCTNCPNVANILASLYESSKYNFYYVALIDDKNALAAERNKELNLYGFPTVYFDGGFKVLVGGDKPTSLYTDAINASLARTVPKIRLTVTSQYQNTTKEVTVTTKLENKENTTYTGRIRLYLTEIISEFVDYEGKPYHFGLVDYLNDTDISVDGNSVLTFSDTKNISAYDYENLMVIGVVFSSINHTGYSNPPSGNPFDAYYADATNATKVVPQGNLPPQIQITSPLKGNVYWNGKQMTIFDKIIQRKHLIKKLGNFSLVHNFLYNKTFLLGKTKVITVDATDDSGIAKVEFYIDGTLRFNDTTAPYQWNFTKISTLKSIFFKEHTLKVIVYDDTGKIATASLVFKARI